MNWLSEKILGLLLSLVTGALIFLACLTLILMMPFMVIWGGLKLYIWFFIRRRSALHRRVAVFGESGSGKTMLLTTFYGHQQAARFKAANGYWLTANDAGQGQGLLAAYFRLEHDRLPPTNRFKYTAYNFTFRVRDLQQPVVFVQWFDYPGEWWTDSPKEEEQQRKKDLVTRLVQSDIAFFLVDGQKFRKDGGNCLRRLFAQFRDELTRHRTILLPSNRRKLARYPSIWVICLSKADLFDGYTVEDFRKQVLQHADAEIRCLIEDLRSMVKEPDLVSIGEEYLLLSSAEFDPESQHVKNPVQTIGIDLIAPISLSAPTHHARRLAQARHQRAGVLKRLVDSVRLMTVGWLKYIPVIGNFFMFFDDSTKKMMETLEGLEEDISLERGILTATMDGMKERLTTPDARRVYLGV